MRTQIKEGTGVSCEGLSSASAKAIIRSLTRGTTIAEGVRYIHVGRSEWLAAQQELLAEIADDGHSDTKFVRGAYGAGKSHFLSVVQDYARSKYWVSCHVECKADGVQIDRFETLYPQIAAKMKLPGGTGDGDVKPVRLLLEQWAARQLSQVTTPDAVVIRPFDAEARLYASLQIQAYCGRICLPIS